MKTKIKEAILFAFIILGTFISSNAQSFDSVYVKKNSFNVPCLYHGNRKIPMREIKIMAKGNIKAQSALKRLRQEKILAYASVLPTSAALGFGLGNLINNSTNDLQYLLLASGVVGYINLIYIENTVKTSYMEQLADALNKR